MQQHKNNNNTKIVEYHLVNATKSHTSTKKWGCFNLRKAQAFPNSGNVQHVSTNLIAPGQQSW